jgi:hypothetical protein
MPFFFVSASEKSIIRACLFALTAGVWAAYIQKVIVKLVELKYVPAGSVR